MPKYPLLVALLCGWLLPLVSGQLQFAHLETDVGMRGVRTIQRDSFGYLWIGQNGKGVLRYDGYEFKNYPIGENGLEGRVFQKIFEDSKRRLWIATTGGLNLYDRKDDSFIRYEHEEGNPFSLGSNALEQVLESGDGTIWVVARNSLNRYDEEEDRFVPWVLEAGELKGEALSNAVPVGDEYMWVVGSGSRIWKLDLQTGEFEGNVVFTDRVTNYRKIYEDTSGRFWVHSIGDGLWEFLPERMEVREVPQGKDGRGISTRNVRDVIEYVPGTLMILVDQGGLNFMDLETREVTYQSFSDGTGNGLTSDGVVSVNIDYEGIIWIGHSKSGIDYFNPQALNFKSVGRTSPSGTGSLLNEVVNCFLELEDGSTLVGTDGGGIYRFEPHNGRISQLELDLGSGVIRQMAQSSDRRLWVATWDSGLYVLREEDGGYRLDEERMTLFEKWKQVGLWDIKIDKKDRIWLTSLGDGLYCMNLYGEGAIPGGEKIAGLHLPWNVNLSIPREGELLITGMEAIYRWRDETQSVEVFAEISDFSSGMYDPVSEEYFVGAFNDGLYRLNAEGELLEHYRKGDVFPDSRIRGIHGVNENEIWVSTEDGLCRLNPNTKEVQVFYKEDGLQGNHFVLNSFGAARDGRLYFGGATGFSSFYPERLSTNQNLPFVYINRIFLFGEELTHRSSEALIDAHPSALERLELNWAQNHLRFEFTGISMTSPQQNQFAYKLEGFDEDWVYTDASHRRAVYTNLDPGTYEFRVKASNNDGLWNEEGVRLAVVIAPPFWMRYWFYAAVALCIGAGLFGYITHREKRLNRDRSKLKGLVDEQTKTLVDYQKQLETHQHELEETVERRTEQLVAARDKAEESNRLKSQFLANLSHEIRTPLNAINGFTTLMDEVEFPPEERAQYSRIVRENSDSLLTLIDDILDFSIIAADQMLVESAPFPLNDLIDNVHSAFEWSEREKPIECRLDNTLSSDELSIVGDRSRIKQVIDNLMTNAFKFTEKGYVKLGVSREEDTLCIYVEDTGPGIPEEETELIFEKFVKRQVDDNAARRGVGLGLAISKRLSQLMNGDLKVDSKIGKGSTFTLSLPLRLDRESAVKADDERKGEGLGEGKRVLIVEDEPTNYQYLEKCFQRKKIDTVWAENGYRGVEFVKEGKGFDLILLDIKMPGIDGYETLNRIRALDSRVPVIAQTAYATKSDENRIRRAGFSDYLAKPIKLKELDRVVEKRLAIGI